jgi:hypothetical protein
MLLFCLLPLTHFLEQDNSTCHLVHISGCSGKQLISCYKMVSVHHDHIILCATWKCQWESSHLGDILNTCEIINGCACVLMMCWKLETECQSLAGRWLIPNVHVCTCLVTCVDVHLCVWVCVLLVQCDASMHRAVLRKCRATVLDKQVQMVSFLYGAEWVSEMHCAVLPRAASILCDLHPSLYQMSQWTRRVTVNLVNSVLLVLLFTSVHVSGAGPHKAKLCHIWAAWYDVRALLICTKKVCKCFYVLCF